jgi:hypothetical protein
MSPVMRRRPLLRAAAVGGGAYVAGKRRAQSQEREAEQYVQPPAPASGGGMAPDAIEQLRQLGELHDQGVLTDEEFAQQKARLLGMH